MVAFGGALVLGSCQQVADDAPVEGRSAPAETVARSADAPAQDYPPLQSVPPRPRLSYTVQQQREIVGALVADRENARYTSQVIRYRSGLSSMPPPPAPPEKLAVAMPQPGQGTGASGAGEAPASKPAGLTEQETLVDFLAMLRRTIFADEPDEPEEAPRPAPSPTATPTTPPDPAKAAGAGETQPRTQVAEAATAETRRIPLPLPPGRSAVAARMASRPQPTDDLLDQSVAQAPLPSLQPGSPDRQDSGQLPETKTSLPPLPAPPPATRPVQVALPSARPPVLAPPPIKPVVPILAPSDPKPAHDQSVQLLPWRRPTAERFG